MRCTRKLCKFLSALAMAAWLSAAASAQDNYHIVTYDDPADGKSEVSVLRAEVKALRQQLTASTEAGYEDTTTGGRDRASCNCDNGGGNCDCAGSCGGCCDQGCCGCCNQGCGCCESCCTAATTGTCGCLEPCYHCPGVWAMGELLILKYHRADGARVGTAGKHENAPSDFDLAPRLSLGWVGCDGLGVRVRWFDFEDSAQAEKEKNSHLTVDTYTIDVEVFDTFCLNRNWDLEIAAGIRYNEFEETMIDDDETRFNHFNGFGIVASAELRRLVGCNGAIFVRTRGAILADDKDVFNNEQGNVWADQCVTLKDVIVGQIELAFGYDYIVPQCDGSYYFARVQAEWQNWYNYSSSFVDTNDNANERFGGPSDVGFAGFGFALGVAR